MWVCRRVVYGPGLDIKLGSFIVWSGLGFSGKKHEAWPSSAQTEQVVLVVQFGDSVAQINDRKLEQVKESSAH